MVIKNKRGGRGKISSSRHPLKNCLVPQQTGRIMPQDFKRSWLEESLHPYNKWTTRGCLVFHQRPRRTARAMSNSRPDSILMIEELPYYTLIALTCRHFDHTYMPNSLKQNHVTLQRRSVSGLILNRSFRGKLRPCISKYTFDWRLPRLTAWTFIMIILDHSFESSLLQHLSVIFNIFQNLI